MAFGNAKVPMTPTASPHQYIGRKATDLLHSGLLVVATARFKVEMPYAHSCKRR